MTDTNAMRAKLISTLKAAGGIHNPEVNAPHIADAILALLATDRAAGVGAGWKLVPVEPTEAMKLAGQDVFDTGWPSTGKVYSAMLAASPPAPADASDFSPHRWTEIVSNGLGANNAGCWRCGALSEVLARVLSLSGHDAKVIQGKANGEDHVWVQIGDSVYDPTVGQFQEPVFYQMDHVAPADASGEVSAAAKRMAERAGLVWDVLPDKADMACGHGMPEGCKEYWRELARAALNPTAGAK